MKPAQASKVNPKAPAAAPAPTIKAPAAAADFEGVRVDGISVLMPAFNRQDFIGQAIESILAQTYKNFELVIYDDGSTDSTTAIATAAAEKDSRIRLIRGAENHGVAYARNRLLEAAKNDILAWIDSDDVVNIHRLELQRRYLETHPHPMVFSNYEEIDQVHFEDRMTKGGLRDGQPQRRLIFRPARASGMFRRWAAGSFDEKIKLCEEDSAWLAAIERLHGKAPTMPEILYFYRHHGDQMHVWMEHPKIKPLRRTAAEATVSYANLIAGLKPRPAVSVLMPAFNAAPWIAEAIQSCLNQTFRDLELIIIDDGSRDKTLEIARGFRDPRIRIENLPKNAGYPAAFNRAFALSRGRYIARLDADDKDCPTRIEKSIRRLEAAPICDCVSTEAYWWEGGQSRVMPNKGMMPHLYMQGANAGCPVNATIVAKREIYDLAGLFNPAKLVGCDSEWDVKAIMAGARWGFVGEPLYWYRRHPGQSVKSVPQEKLSADHRDCCAAHRPMFEDGLRNVYAQIEMITTSACNQKCPHCSQAKMMEKNPGYFASLESVEKLCRRAAEVGADYTWLQFSGGEPFLWKDLEAAANLAKESGIFKKIRVMTNCRESEKMFRLLEAGTVDFIYAERFNSNGQTLTRLTREYPGRCRVGGIRFKPLPDKPMAKGLPAECNCDRLSILGNGVYPCGNFVTHTLRLGWRLEDCRDLWTTLDDDWIAFFRKVDRFNMEICRYCLANTHVWQSTPI